MKITTKSIFLISSGLILVLFIVGFLILMPLMNFQIGFNDAARLAEMQFDQYVCDNEFSGYFSENQRYTDVKKYNINIKLFPSENWIESEVKIFGVAERDSIDRLDFNFYNSFNIDSVLLNGKKANFEYENMRLSITDLAEISDSFEVVVGYHGTPENKGFGSFSFGRFLTHPVIYTLNEPVYASTWFPCNDLPDDKAQLDIKIENDKEFTSLSNGKLIGVDSLGLRKTYHWKTIYPLSTYLVAIYSADYNHIRQNFEIMGDSLEVDYYFLNGKTEAGLKDFKLNKDILVFFSEKFGMYPFINEKYGIAEFLWKLGAMENQTIVGVGENFVSGLGFMNDLLIHEAAHQWWGNAVGPKTWKDVWLNEGFATYSEALFYENQSGKDALISTMLAKKRDYYESPLYNPSTNLFSNLVYNKGAWVLHMLRFEIGDDLFFESLRNYYNEFKYSSASTSDFIKVCEQTTGKDLSLFFNQWVLDGEGILKVNYKYEFKKSKNKFFVKLDLNQIQDEYPDYKFTLEIEAVGDGLNDIHKFYIESKDTMINFETSALPDSLIIDPNFWLLADFNKEI